MLPGYCPEGHPGNRQMDPPDKANCTSGRHEPHGYQGLPKGSVRLGYEGNLGHGTSMNVLWGKGGRTYTFSQIVGKARTTYKDKHDLDSNCFTD